MDVLRVPFFPTDEIERAQEEAQGFGTATGPGACSIAASRRLSEREDALAAPQESCHNLRWLGITAGEGRCRFVSATEKRARTRSAILRYEFPIDNLFSSIPLLTVTNR